MNPTLQTQTNNESAEKDSPSYGVNDKNNYTTQKGGFSEEDYYVELKYRSVKNAATGKLAGGLALFSIGLGLAELLAPARLSEMIGVDKSRQKLLPLFGAREIASGIAIMKSQNPTKAVWSRVAGDAMDLAYLASAYASGETSKSKVTAALAAVLGVTALDVICAQKLSQGFDETESNPQAPTTVGQSSARHSVNE